MLFVVSLILNILVFLLLFNLPWLVERRKRPGQPGGPPFKSVVMPVTLGVALTILDAMRLQFFMQMGILMVLAAVLYGIFSIFLRK